METDRDLREFFFSRTGHNLFLKYKFFSLLHPSSLVKLGK